MIEDARVLAGERATERPLRVRSVGEPWDDVKSSEKRTAQVTGDADQSFSPDLAISSQISPTDLSGEDGMRRGGASEARLVEGCGGSNSTADNTESNSENRNRSQDGGIFAAVVSFLSVVAGSGSTASEEASSAVDMVQREFEDLQSVDGHAALEEDASTVAGEKDGIRRQLEVQQEGSVDREGGTKPVLQTGTVRLAGTQESTQGETRGHQGAYTGTDADTVSPRVASVFQRAHSSSSGGGDLYVGMPAGYSYKAILRRHSRGPGAGRDTAVAKESEIDGETHIDIRGDMYVPESMRYPLANGCVSPTLPSPAPLLACAPQTGGEVTAVPGLSAMDAPPSTAAAANVRALTGGDAAGAPASAASGMDQLVMRQQRAGNTERTEGLGTGSGLDAGSKIQRQEGEANHVDKPTALNDLRGALTASLQRCEGRRGGRDVSVYCCLSHVCFEGRFGAGGMVQEGACMHIR